jgi:hypothetical protein
MMVRLLLGHARKNGKLSMLALSVVFTTIQLCVFHNQHTVMIYSSVIPTEEEATCVATSSKPLCHTKSRPLGKYMTFIFGDCRVHYLGIAFEH